MMDRIIGRGRHAPNLRIAKNGTTSTFNELRYGDLKPSKVRITTRDLKDGRQEITFTFDGYVAWRRVVS